MNTTGGSQTGPGARRATVPLTTGIIATVAYLMANPLLGVRPADLVPGPSTGVFMSVTLPLLLVPPIVLGVVAIATGRSALGRSSARARAGAGIALGLAAAAQAVVYGALLYRSFSAA